MTATEKALAALRAAARFADFVAETSGDEDAIQLHRQCTEAIGALREESEREASREKHYELAAA
ncbi:MAG: hypothetical protein ACREEM_23305 [Blastocatellia bacterium]